MDSVDRTNPPVCEYIKNGRLSRSIDVKLINKFESIIPSTPDNPTKYKAKKRAVTTNRKKALQDLEAPAASSKIVLSVRTTAKKTTRSKSPPASQLRIDTFFKSCTKSYKIEPHAAKDENICSIAGTAKKSGNNKKRCTNKTHKKKGRKRLFKEDESTTTASSLSGFEKMTQTPPRYTRKRSTSAVTTGGCVKKTKPKSKDILDTLIDLITEDKSEVVDVKPNLTKLNEQLHSVKSKNFGDNLSEMTNGNMSSSVMVSIPVCHKSSDIPFENPMHVTTTTKYHIEEKLVLFEKKNNLLTNVATNGQNIVTARKSSVDVKIDKETIMCNGKIKKESTSCNDQTSEPCSRSSMKKTSPNKYDKSRDNGELLVATPPTPPQTSTDTFSSNCVSNNNKRSNTNKANVQNKNTSFKNTTPKITETTSTSKGVKMKKARVCPPYKIVDGTTFAVDAFQFGQIKEVTHYFLTHFHADHYQGLTRKFSMPLYLSPLTARLVRAFIPIEDVYINEIELNTPLIINNVEVTAIDANHCPGAVLFLFKLSTGRCILHTGDFRASPDMESEPIFWNNWIDTVYLDTTYIAHKHNFCAQQESIDRAKGIIETFHKERPTTRLLYICGSYVIGKERFWTSLAHEFGLKVWTEKNRLTALRAMDLDEVQGLLCDDPFAAQMHVISIGKVSYQSLVEYFRPFQEQFDAVLAFRPSGWEKNSKPSLRGQINIVGIEYSEHSSNAELERFIKYLKPRDVISTVPAVYGNPCITPKIPEKWYKYDTLKSRQRNFQPSITSFMKIRNHQPTHATCKRTINCVTPTKSAGCERNELSQQSVRAITTRVLQHVQPDDDDDDVVFVDMQASSSKDPAAAAVKLFADQDAIDDRVS